MLGFIHNKGLAYFLMLGRICGQVRNFSAKAKERMKFTEPELKKLEKVYLDPQIAAYFRWKRYPINNQVFFSGEADIISWENRKVGNGSLEEVKEKAENQKLDLVLVCPKPPIIRIMNYKNWILSWAFKERIATAIYTKKKQGAVYRLSLHISEGDLETKLNKFLKSFEETGTVTIEAHVNSEHSLEEQNLLRKFEFDFSKKLKDKFKFHSMSLKTTGSEFSVKFIIKKPQDTLEAYDGAYPLDSKREEMSVAEKKVVENYVPPDEEEFMERLLQGKVVKETEEIEYIDEKQEENYDLKKGVSDYSALKKRVTWLVGDSELAGRFLKSRFKVK
jgi:translation initiation factor IF-3